MVWRVSRAAVAAVLARYAEVETVPLGLCRKGIAIAVSLATPHGGTLRSIAAQATMVLDHIEFGPSSIRAPRFSHRIN